MALRQLIIRLFWFSWPARIMARWDQRVRRIQAQCAFGVPDEDRIDDPDLLFEVVSMRDGRRYSIFTTGRIDGFGPDCYVSNHYGRLVREEIRSAAAAVSPKERATNDSSGGAHREAPRAIAAEPTNAAAAGDR